MVVTVMGTAYLFLMLLLSRAPIMAAQTASTTSPTDALTMLKETSQHYKDAKSYFVQATEITHTASEYEQTIERRILIAGEAPGNRYFFEGQSNFGGALKVSDGEQVWTYRIDEHRYTAQTVLVATASDRPKVVALDEMTMNESQHLRKRLADLGNQNPNSC